MKLMKKLVILGIASATLGNAAFAAGFLPYSSLQLATTSAEISLCSVVPLAPGQPPFVRHNEIIYMYTETYNEYWVYYSESGDAICWNTALSRWEDVYGDPIYDVYIYIPRGANRIVN